MTGYPSIDKPWLKYYSEEAINEPLPECTIYEYLWENNKDHLDDVALVYFGRKITYKTLFSEIEKTASAFFDAGIRAGDIVLMTTVTVPETIYAFYALNRIGAISNMADPRTSTEGIRRFAQEVNAKIILTIDVAYPKIAQAAIGTSVKHIITLSPADSLPPIKKAAYKATKRQVKPVDNNCQSWREFIASSKNGISFPPIRATSDCCVMVHTGGTTGTPKTVMLSNQNLNTMAMQYALLGIDLDREQSFLNIMPPFIAYGVVLGIHMPLCLGLNDILIPQLDPNKFADLILKYRPAHLAGVPMHYEQLRTSPKAQTADLSFFCMTGCGGDGMAEGFEIAINEFLFRHNCKYPITKGYGMTEISSAATTNKLELNKLGSVGIPHLKTTVAIFEVGTDKELPYGESGEICMCSPTVMLGYYNAPDEEKNVLMKHSDGKTWIHSGDIGYMDEDGFLYINGRLKRMIIRPDGHNVWPSQIENVILSYPGIESCAVVGLPNPNGTNGMIPTAFIVADDNEITADAIDAYSKERLPERDCALEYRFVSEIPLTPIGKVDYRALEQQAAGN